jgi:hypothetical protein
MDSDLDFLIDSYITFELFDTYSYQFNLYNHNSNVITNVIVYNKIEIHTDSKDSYWLPETYNDFTLQELIESKSYVLSVNYRTSYIEFTFNDSTRIKLFTTTNNESFEIRSSNGYYLIY